MKDRLTRIFYGVFSVCFVMVIWMGIAQNEDFKPLWLILVTAACVVAFPLIYRLLSRYETTLEKHYNKILIIFVACMLITEVITGLVLRYDPAWDVGAVQHGAAEWVDTGTFRNYYDYYSGFPNNLGSMAFLAVFLKLASLVGITDYYAVGVVITSIMIAVTISLVSLVCRSFAGAKGGVFAIVLFALSAQYWFLGGAVYTDALSMMFPVLIYWLYLVSKKQDGAKKVRTYLLMGIAAAVGSLVKFTVIIMLVAIVIDMCFNYNPKEILKAAVCFGGVIAVVMLSFNAYIYSNHLDREIKYKEARPYIHWVMMGLNSDYNGKYNPGDYSFTDALEDLSEKREKDGEVAAQRVKELGVPGMYKLIAKKSAIDFGDGTYGSTDFFWISPQHETKLHDWVISGRKNYNKYGTYVSSVQTAVMLFMLLGAIAALFKKNDGGRKLLPLYAAVFGIWLFLMCWEANRRYFVNFAPVILICGMCGVDLFVKTKVLDKFKLHIK